MKNLIPFLVCLALLSSSCTKKKVEESAPTQPVSAEEIVRNFVRLSTQAKDLPDKNGLSALCSGDMKSAFETMNEEQFRLFYLNGNLNIKEFKITSVNKEDGKTKVQYQVTVENRQGTDVTHEVNEREADLVESPSGWLIEAIRPKGVDKLIFSKGMTF